MKKILVALLVAMLLLCSAALAEGIAPTPTPIPTATPAPIEPSTPAEPDLDEPDCEGDHTFISENAWIEYPSCEQYGTKYNYCIDCKVTVEIGTVEPQGHKYDNIVGKVEEGHTLKCTRCGGTKLEKHSWIDMSDKPVKEATCTVDGYKYVKCKECNYDSTLTLKAPGHKPGKEPVKTVAATCTEAGYEIWECSVCHKTETVALKALGHKIESWVIAQNPSCTQDGLMYGYCVRPCCSNTVLNKQYKETKVIKAAGHKYDADRLEIVEVKGKKYVTGYCLVCHEMAYAPYSGKLPANNADGFIANGNTGNVTTGGGNTENSTANKPTTNKAGVTIPATGETTSIAPIMMVLAIAGLAVLAATKQKVNG